MGNFIAVLTPIEWENRALAKVIHERVRPARNTAFTGRPAARLIDCSFGILGCVPLLICRRSIVASNGRNLDRTCRQSGVCQPLTALSPMG